MSMALEPPDARGGRLPVNTFFYVGVVQLLGWNAVLTASGFLDHDVFPGKQWAFLAAIIYSVGVTSVQALMIRGPLPRLPFSVRWTMSVTFMAAAPMGLLLLVSQTLDGAMDSGLTFAIALACVLLLAMGAAMFQASTFGLAGAAGAALSGRLMMGQGFGGIITGVASVAQPSMTTFAVLIGATTVITSAGLLVYWLRLRNHPYIRPLVEQMAEDRLRPPCDTPLSAALSSPGCIMASPRRRGRLIAMDVGPQAAGVLFVFTVTFSVFPGAVNRWSGAFGLSSTHFVTLMVGEFQLLDVLGRTVGGFVSIPNGKVTLAASFSRIVFLPLFIGAQRMEGSFLSSGAWKVFIMAIFAFSNGFVSTLGMMLGPQHVAVKEEKETAGHIMSFSLAPCRT